jgi:hypothetical protein
MVPLSLADFIDHPPPFLSFVCLRVYEEHLDEFIFKISTFRFLSVNNLHQNVINIIES